MGRDSKNVLKEQGKQINKYHRRRAKCTKRIKENTRQQKKTKATRGQKEKNIREEENKKKKKMWKN